MEELEQELLELKEKARELEEKLEKIKEVEKMLIYNDLKKFAEEHNTEKIDWNNTEQKKYYINYRYAEDILMAPYTKNLKSIGQIYFTSYEIVERAVKEIGEENIIKLFD